MGEPRLMVEDGFEYGDRGEHIPIYRRPTLAEKIAALQSEGVGEVLVLADDELGVIEKTQLAGACYDEGPYWNLPAGRYLVARVEDGET